MPHSPGVPEEYWKDFTYTPLPIFRWGRWWPAFQPSDLQPKLWLAADRIKGLADGVAVAQWSDASGNNNHATQATGTKQPLYRPTGLNGRPSLQFDGVDDQLTTASFASALSQPNTIFMVVKAISASGSPRFCDGDSAGTTRHLIGITDAAADQWFIYSGTGVNEASGTADFNEHIHAAVFNSPSSSLHVDGTAKITGATTGAHMLSLLNVGSSHTPGNFLSGHIAEIIVYNRALSDTERKSVEVYLGTKYGITVAA